MSDDHHIVKSFDEELEHIEGLLLKMAGYVEAQVTDCVEALIKQDVDLVKRVQQNDLHVDRLEDEIDDLAIQILAKRQPLAQDLRTIVSVLKISSDLERIGDYCKNIATRTKAIVRHDGIDSSLSTLKRMSAIVIDMMHGVVDSYIKRDVSMADLLRERDQDVDQMHNTLFRELLTHMMEEPKTITSSMHLLFIAKNFERIGDHATNIAEQVHYIVDGTRHEDGRPKGDKTSRIFVELPTNGNES